jgi:hypothetical protein
MFKKAIRTSALLGIVQGTIEAHDTQQITAYFIEENPTPPIGTIAESGIRENLDETSLYFYGNMDREGKQLVYQLVHQECKGENKCKGLNSCEQSGINSCAGKGSCKGTSKGPFEDQNLAVKVAVNKICERRILLNKENPLN